VTELVRMPARDRRLSGRRAIPGGSLYPVGDGAPITVGVIPLAGPLARPRLLPGLLRGRDLGLARQALGGPALGLGLAGLEEEGLELGPEPRAEDHLGLGADEDGAALARVLGLVLGRYIFPSRARHVE